MITSHPLLSRCPARPVASIALLPEAEELSLSKGRVHEACGPARQTFAMWLAVRTQGPVIWIAPGWAKAKLHSDGIARWIDPARLVFVHPNREEDLLWSMEETLRSGAVSLTIADLATLPGLTQIRRMHLAAENGAQSGQGTPLGLLLTPGQGGAPGVETRWSLACRHAKEQDGWNLERLRARTAPHKSWHILQSQKEKHLRVKAA